MTTKMPIQDTLPGVLSAREILRDYHRELGRRGGQSTSERKAQAAARNAYWARLCRRIKCASLRMEKAREDIQADRIMPDEYKAELRRYQAVYTEYMEAARNRGIVTGNKEP